MRYPTLLVLGTLASCSAAETRGTGAPDGWRTEAPRDEIRPAFRYNGTFVIEHDRREGLQGWWARTYDVQGGRSYRFRAVRRVKGVDLPRRSASARLVWGDAQGRPVLLDEPWTRDVLKNFAPTAEAEHPLDRETDAAGWTEVMVGSGL